MGLRRIVQRREKETGSLDYRNLAEKVTQYRMEHVFYIWRHKSARSLPLQKPLHAFNSSEGIKVSAAKNT